MTTHAGLLFCKQEEIVGSMVLEDLSKLSTGCQDFHPNLSDHLQQEKPASEKTVNY